MAIFHGDDVLEPCAPCRDQDAARLSAMPLRPLRGHRVHVPARPAGRPGNLDQTAGAMPEPGGAAGGAPFGSKSDYSAGWARAGSMARVFGIYPRSGDCFISGLGFPEDVVEAGVEASCAAVDAPPLSV